MEKKYKGYTIKIVQDESPSNPREDDNIGTFVCWHRRYTLGDKNPFGTPQDALAHFKSTEAVVLPVFMYDHSGLAFSTSQGYPFNDRWDAGQVGFIYCEMKKAREIFGDAVTKEYLTEKINNILESEIKTYDQYQRGDVWGFIVEDAKSEELDSCWGFYGSEYCEQSAKESIDATVARNLKAKAKKTKAYIKNKVSLEARLKIA